MTSFNHGSLLSIDELWAVGLIDHRGKPRCPPGQLLVYAGKHQVEKIYPVSPVPTMAVEFVWPCEVKMEHVNAFEPVFEFQYKQ